MIKETHYHVVSPDGETVLFLEYANARDMVRNCGWSWAKGTEKVAEIAKAEATKNAFVNGNDPRKAIDVDEIQKLYDNEGDWLEVMAKEDLTVEAKKRGIEVDKRWGRDRLITETRKTIDSGADDE